MSRSFAKPAFSRTVTIDIKQLTTSTQNTFTFQNYLSYFGRWLEKFTELRSNWRSAPPPTAPPSSLSSTCWLDPFSMDVEKGKDTSVLRLPGTAGHHPGGATALGEWTPPRTGSSIDGGRWFLPASFPTKGSSFPGRCCWPPPFAGSLVGPAR